MSAATSCCRRGARPRSSGTRSSAVVAAEGGRPVGLGARDTLRTEMGYPLHGQDLSPTITPVQARAGLGGRLEQAGVRRTRRAARREGGRSARGGCGGCGPPTAVSRVRTWRSRTRRGAVIGEVTSGTFSPTLRTGIGLALLTPTLESEGAEVTVDVRGRPSTMTVVRPRSWTPPPAEHVNACGARQGDVLAQSSVNRHDNRRTSDTRKVVNATCSTEPRRRR